MEKKKEVFDYEALKKKKNFQNVRCGITFYDMR